jgi:hypothetical protein
MKVGKLISILKSIPPDGDLEVHIPHFLLGYLKDGLKDKAEQMQYDAEDIVAKINDVQIFSDKDVAAINIDVSF